MKLLVSDFDHTLWTENSEWFNQNIQAIKNWQALGNLFVIATGRGYDSLLKDLKKNAIPFDALICNTGAFILNHDKTLLEISIEEAFPIIDFFKNESLIVDWYIDHGSVLTKQKKGPIFSLVAQTIDKEQNLQVLDRLKHKFPQIDGYVSTSYINLIPKGISKSTGIKFLQEYYHLDTEDIFTIGDSENDYEMLRDFKGYAITSQDEKIASLDLMTFDKVADMVNYLTEKVIQ